MSTITKNRRKQTRYEVPVGRPSSVEFKRGGRAHRLAVVNLSASGLSFVVDAGAGLPALEAGTNLGKSVVRIGDCVLRGEMLVMHVTGTHDSRYLCGALFYPATDADLVRLKRLIADLEVAGAD
jgi:hypothetical protein